MSQGPRSSALAEALRRVESPGITTLQADWPIFWESASGSTVVDVDGREYLDLTAAFGVASVGHCNPRVAQAVAQQASRLMHGMGDVHPPAVKVQLLEALAAVTPAGLDLAILGLNGADAVEAALKCVELTTGRAAMIAFEGAYHGLAGGALSVTWRKDFREPFAGRLGGHTSFLEFPTTDSAADRVLAGLRARISGAGPAVGGVIIEPIQGRAGVRVPAPGFMSALRDLCTELDVLLIADEIFTGLGRTGAWFACEHDDVIPDLLCVGKALGGGMPLSACVGGSTSVGRWPVATGEAIHTSTFLGHPVSCAAACASLSELSERELPARAAALEARVRSALAGAPIEDVRGRGLMLGVELDSGERAFGVVKAALSAGLILLPSGEDGRVISITPPLVITDDELDRALEVLAACL